MILRLLLAAAAFLSFALVACDSDSKDSDLSSPTTSAKVTDRPLEPATTQATATASASPTLTFEEFAVQIEDAIESGSSDVFLQNPILTEFECPNKLLGDCGDGPEPTIIQSLVLARWRSEGYPATEAEFQAELDQYYTMNPRLVAIAVKEVEGEAGTPTYYAITAADGDPESTAVFAFKEDEGEFRMQLFMLAPVLGEDWTSGECGECYDQWDPW